MAVFTFIGTTIATAIGGALITTSALGVVSLTLLGSVVAGVIAAGLAFGTAKLLGVFDVPDVGAGRANGSKVQVAPSTDNRIGIAYGRNFMSGPITDVAITNQNKTMQYCITLSELSDGHNVGSYTVNQIFWGDRKLNFPGGYSNATSANVISYSDPNATSTDDWANKIRIRVYAGDTTAAKQIFPASPTVNATTVMTHWNTFGPTHYTMEGLVFAMIEVDYDAENGLTGLGSMTFDITNSKDNPGEVLFDYLKSSRYGAGLANADIDITSILGTANTHMKGYADEQITYTPNTGGSSTIDRYQINGYLSTFDSCMDNIDKICRNAATYFTFDGKQGKFAAIPNRPYSTSELSSAFVLNDDNIVSKISVSSTELYQQLNSITVEFADQNRKDQTNTILVETPSGDRNTGEPDNNLDYRAELVNNNIHAQQLGNIDLNQSRKGMVVECTSDFSGLQIDAGDVVKLTNSDYGFSNKLFRVMKNTEALGQDGMIMCNLLLLEYDATVYTEAVATESDVEDDPTGIITNPPADNPPPPNVYKHFYANVTQKSTTGSGSGASFDIQKDFVNLTYFVPAVSGGSYLANGGSGYNNGDSITVSGNQLGGLDGLNDCTFTVATSLQPVGYFQTAGTVSGDAFIYGGGGSRKQIDGESMGDLAAGTQITATPEDKTDLNAGTTYQNLQAAPVDVDLTEVDSGEYTINNNAKPVGSHQGITNADYGYGVQADVTYANGTTQNNVVDSRTTYPDRAEQPDTVNSPTKFTVTDQMASVAIRLVGYNTSNQTAGTNQRGFENMKLDIQRIRNADQF